jgi:diguanylate cyclase (GGDEF)-like protein/PAS domain S-box-containing protein
VRERVPSGGAQTPPRARWRRRHAYAVRLMACFACVAVATVSVEFAPDANLIWVANGLLLAYLLLAPRRRWPAYLLAGLLAQLAGSAVVNPHWWMNLLMGALNIAEVAIAALLLRRRSQDLPCFTERAYLVRFFAFAVLAAPLATGLVYATLAPLWSHQSFWVGVLQWLTADSLGIAVATPACAAIFQERFRNKARRKRDLAYPALLAAFAVAVFSQGWVPLPFLIYPLLLLVLLRLGLGWSAMSTLFVAGVGSWFTGHGHGPFAVFRSLGPQEPAILLQVFIAAGMFMIYAVSVVLASHRAAERSLQKFASLHTLVTENCRDAILIVDFDGLPSYVSPAMKRMTGWDAEEMMKLGGREVVHPDDQARIHAVVKELHAGDEGAMTEYRVRKRDGQYIWMEASLSAFVDPATGVASGTLNIIRDITERKRAERELQAAYRAVEALAVVDALTGIANRRRLDQCLTAEWRRGLRERKPLSLLLIDADLFKTYNDTYGHVRGDSCLKQIAEAAQDVVARPGDLVARYGGEEFAILLPDTDRDGAMLIADEICEALWRRRLPHSCNPTGFVTISIGCATIVPGLGQHVGTLVEAADRALYGAKQGGRNRVCGEASIGGANAGREIAAAASG